MNEMKDSDSATLARIDERTMAQGVTLTAHVKDDGDRFDKVFNFVSKRFDKMDERFDKTDKKLDTLWDEKSERKGAFSASKLLTGALWAAVVLGASWFLPEHKP